MHLVDLLLIAALVAFSVALALVTGSVPVGLFPFAAGCVGLWYLLGDE